MLSPYIKTFGVYVFCFDFLLLTCNVMLAGKIKIKSMNFLKMWPRVSQVTVLDVNLNRYILHIVVFQPIVFAERHKLTSEWVWHN